MSPALRIKRVLNWIRNFGFMLAAGLLLLSVADGRLVLVAVIAYAAHVGLAKGSPTAAAVLVLLALGMALYFEGAYQEALARVGDRPWATRGGSVGPSTDSGLRSLIELNRTLAWACVGLGAVYAGGFALASLYRRRAPTPRSRLGWRRWWALRAGFLRAQMTPKAALYGALSLFCALIVLAPGLIGLVALILHVPRTERTAPILEWAFAGHLGWWWTVVSWALVGACLNLWTRAKRQAASGLTRAPMLDERQPFLLLRSFADDTTSLDRTVDQNSSMRQVVSPGIWTLEESLEHILRHHGPVIAVGRPGESLPPPGAAREYVDTDRWKSRIEELIGEARLVVVVLGETEGLRFEYDTLQRLGALSKMILVVPPRPTEELSARWEPFLAAFAPSRSILNVDLSRVLVAYFSSKGIMTLVLSRRRNDEDCYRLALNRALTATFSPAPPPCA